jgi:excisionase family DNA binding protein
MRVNLFTPKETADVLRVSLPTIRRMIHDGRLKAIKISSAYRIKESEIERLLGEPTRNQQRIADQVERDVVKSAMAGMLRR